MSPELKSLPAELILEVTDKIHNKADREAFRSTCRRFRALIKPTIWPRRPSPDNDSKEAGEGINAALIRREEKQHLDFLWRLFKDLPKHQRSNKTVCRECRAVRICIQDVGCQNQRRHYYY